MFRRIAVAGLLGAALSTAVAAPGPGLTPSVAAASCSGWTSNTQPPPTVRVFRHASGAVETVDFRAYTKNVLSREWIASWTTESLRSGALAVRNYAWYQVLHWRGGTNTAGQCFDVRDDTWDQVYDPSRPTYSTAAAAVDATWSMLVHRNGAVFPTYYNAGAVNEACGANANGWKAYQWGTQACGLSGKSAAQIIQTYYYPGVTVSGGAATPSPTPTPSPTAVVTPTPVPTATATPTPTAQPTGSPSAGSSSTPTPAPTTPPTPQPTAAPATPVPTPVPTPVATPLPTPPPDQALPGGGQAGVEDASAPPPPPPASPLPTVAVAAEAGVLANAEPMRAAGRLRWSVLVTRLDALDAVVGSPQNPAFRRVAGMHAAAPVADLRLLAFRAQWPLAVDALLDAVVAEIGPRRAVAGDPVARR